MREGLCQGEAFSSVGCRPRGTLSLKMYTSPLADCDLASPDGDAARTCLVYHRTGLETMQSELRLANWSRARQMCKLEQLLDTFLTIKEQNTFRTMYARLI